MRAFFVRTDKIFMKYQKKVDNLCNMDYKCNHKLKLLI